MVAQISPQTCQVIKACIPALKAHGVEITTQMYHHLLADKQIRDLFNLSHQRSGQQPEALAFAILAYAEHIEDPAVLGDMVERIAQKHVGLNILPQHYPYVGKALLGAIKSVLGEAATEPVMQAWREAYEFLADLLMAREAQLYKKDAEAPGGWTGWRTFFVASRRVETDDAVSFILKPVDRRPVMKHLPGQYLSFKFNVPGSGSQRRNYTISSAPSSDYYRITVKRQKDGIVSNWVDDHIKEGDKVDVSAPAGDFYLEDKGKKPLYFVAAGSGITPVMSMLLALSERRVRPEIYLAYMNHRPSAEIFASDIKELVRSNILRTDLFYTREAPEDVTSHEGHITADWLARHDKANAQYYICGPCAFMVQIIHGLHVQGIHNGDIHYELFGSVSDPQLVTRAA